MPAASQTQDTGTLEKGGEAEPGHNPTSHPAHVLPKELIKQGPHLAGKCWDGGKGMEKHFGDVAVAQRAFPCRMHRDILSPRWLLCPHLNLT